MTPPLTIGDARMRSANIDIAAGDGYASRARRVLDDVVPRAASTAQARLNRVLWVAAGPTSASQDRALFDAAAFVGQTSAAGPDDAPAEARRLHDEARRAYRVRRHVPEAFDLAMKAFGANPNDPDAAGHLAFLHLKTLPSQPERARQLALVAIGLRGSASMSIRVDDWTTFAVASALTGRTADARNALYASSVLSRDAEYSCRSAMAALVTWGDRMRDAVESLLHRLQAQGRVEEASACAASSRVAAYRFQ